MLNTVIVDNEEPAINFLRILLEKTGQVKVLESFTCAEDFLSCFPRSRPDAVFLDIEMPGIKGLELAEKLLEIDDTVEIVFVTAYGQYALEAFRVNALDYLMKPLSFEAVSRTVSRLLKRKGSLPAPVTGPATARICCFGRLSVYGPGCEHPVRWRTSKSEELFAYLLQRLGEETPKWKICEALWPEYDMEKVDVYLHTTLYKMKKVLAGAGIVYDIRFSNGCYRMDLPRISVDTAEFDAIVSSAPQDGEIDIERYEKAFSMYKGDYLEDNDYLWSLSKKEEYSKKYHSLATSMVKYHMQKNEYAAAEKVLRSILDKSPLNEAAHEMLLKLYFIKRDRSAFAAHYNAVCRLFRAELVVEPGSSIKALYNSMLYS